MKLEGGERLVLKSLLGLQGDSGDYVEDARLAASTKMFVQDVRDWLETLEGKGLVERARGTEGFSAYVTAKGKQALRLTEPMPATGQAPSPKTSTAPTQPSSARTYSPGLPQEADARTRETGLIQVFFSYSHKDEALRDELEEHLSLLKRQGTIAGWHDRRIGAGDEWKDKIDEN